MRISELVKGHKFRPRPKKEGTYDARGNDRTIEVINTNPDGRGRIDVYSVNHQLGHTRRIQISAKHLVSYKYTLITESKIESAEAPAVAA